MRASSGTSSSSSALAFAGPTNNVPTAPDSSEDSPPSFADVLQQQGATSGATTPEMKPIAKSPANPAPVAKGVGVTIETQPIAALAQAKSVAVVAENPTVNLPVAKVAPASPASGQTGTTAMSTGSDLATIMVQAMLLASHPRTANAPTATAKTSTATGNDPAPSDASAKGTTPPVVSMSALLAQISAVPASAVASATSSTTAAVATTAINSGKTARSGGNGREIPLSTSTRTSGSSTTKEKKSSVEVAEGSFLQSSSTAAKGGETASSLGAGVGSMAGDALGQQQVATQSQSGKNAPDNSAASALASVGTAHVEKKAPMTTELNMSQVMPGTAANSTARTPAQVNILLSSNSDFEDALKQVVHIAQINESAAMRTPTRIAIELQTPPGAIVNVYVSKQNDQYRAQLSTTDPAALSWVQDKITSLRQSDDAGVTVKWLPAQIESNSLSATTSSSHGSNLDWNRDGQNQNQQTPDDRSPSQHQETSFEDLAEAEAETFSDNLAAVGGAA